MLSSVLGINWYVFNNVNESAKRDLNYICALKLNQNLLKEIQNKLKAKICPFNEVNGKSPFIVICENIAKNNACPFAIEALITMLDYSRDQHKNQIQGALEILLLAEKPNEEAIELVLQSGADPTLNIKGKFPQEIAAEKDALVVGKLLLEYMPPEKIALDEFKTNAPTAFGYFHSGSVTEAEAWINAIDPLHGSYHSILAQAFEWVCTTHQISKNHEELILFLKNKGLKVGTQDIMDLVPERLQGAVIRLLFSQLQEEPVDR